MIASSTYSVPPPARFGWRWRLLVYLGLLLVDAVLWWAMIAAANGGHTLAALALAVWASPGMAMILMVTFLWMGGLGQSLSRIMARGLLAIPVVYVLMWALSGLMATVALQRPSVLWALQRRPGTPWAVFSNFLSLCLIVLLVGVPRTLRRVSRTWDEVSLAWASRTTQGLALAAAAAAVGASAALYAGYGTRQSLASWVTVLAVAVLATKGMLPALRWSIRMSWTWEGWRSGVNVLGEWRRRQRAISRTEQDLQDNRDWPPGIAHARGYASSKGTVLVPRDCTFGDFRLAWWIHRQRWLKGRGRLLASQIVLLEQLPGWDWEDHWSDPSRLDRLRGHLTGWRDWARRRSGLAG